MNDRANFSPADRVESLKVGIVAGLSALLAFGAIATINTLILAPQFDALASLRVGAIDLNFAFRGAMALLAGFLFGVTYRYAIRDDRNPQLKSGVVLAFGLVRACGELDAGLFFEGWQIPAWQVLLPFAARGIESVLLFAIAALVLDRTRE
ncbi:MAG: hypothetical protein HC786_31920 [Richelia sp. CSU_2_1]|nr:hypothetical protein [Microcoleus sp. SU_5_6]NJR26380.1 hypothetical protein [Richelia sp. CSU_2_1]